MYSEEDLKALRSRYWTQFGDDGIYHFAKEQFGGLLLDEWQREAAKEWVRGTRKVSVRSGHGVGKGLWISVLVWAQLVLKYPQKTAITAPSRPQLEDALLTEIIKTGERMDPALRAMFKWQPGKGRLELLAKPAMSFMQAKTARQEKPEALSGVHSEDVMLIADEAAAVDDANFENAIGSLNGPNRRMFLTGNPTRPRGLFHRTQTGEAVGWKTFHVCGDPKYPGADFYGRTTAQYRQEIIDLYGRHSNQYRVRVLGEFPNMADNAVIPWELIEQAQSNFLTIKAPVEHNVEVWGLDVARGEGDQNALVRRRGRLVLPLIETWHERDVMLTVGRVKRAYDKAKYKPSVICVDDIGVGGGVTDRLRELGLPVRPVNVSSKLVSREEFATRKTELWMDVREWLQGGNVGLPTHCECGSGQCKDRSHAARLASELGEPQQDVSDSTGKLIIEPKKVMKKRGVQSPNIADALVLTFAVNVSIISHGKRSRGVFGRRIKRNLSVV